MFTRTTANTTGGRITGLIVAHPHPALTSTHDTSTESQNRCQESNAGGKRCGRLRVKHDVMDAAATLLEKKYKKHAATSTSEVQEEGSRAAAVI